jgi:hypothetical protein
MADDLSCKFRGEWAEENAQVAGDCVQKFMVPVFWCEIHEKCTLTAQDMKRRIVCCKTCSQRQPCSS